jgi:glutamate synthase domain-containing protein 3
VVPELRDYQQINSELVRRLNAGQTHVRLEGVEGQRLLVSQLKGHWHAVIEVEGNAGPELAADLDSPGLTVVCHGSAADGAGRGMSAGRLLILGTAGSVLGYVLRGGLIVAARPVGPRAGLGPRGGDLFLLDRCGALAGERQSGGRLYLHPGLAGTHLGFGSRQGEVIRLDQTGSPAANMQPDVQRQIEEAAALAGRFGFHL